MIHVERPFGHLTTNSALPILGFAERIIFGVRHVKQNASYVPAFVSPGIPFFIFRLVLFTGCFATPFPARDTSPVIEIAKRPPAFTAGVALEHICL